MKEIIEVDIKNELKKYNREDVLKETIKYFNGDTLAAEVWVNKYALKDSDGNLFELTPNDTHKRMAKEFARIEKNYPNELSEDVIYDLMKNFKYIIPQGSPMAGIGNNFQYVSLSNCFVIGNDNDSDSYGGILKLDQELVQLMKRRAGVGLDLSFVRPKGSSVKNSALTSTGVVPFMERFSNSTREVAQDGRRGALMESISINHPDSESFIDAKMDEKKVTGANVSVRISDSFMKAALNNKNFIQKYPIDSNEPKFTKEIDANLLWKKITHNAWKRAEPGILFWDTIINESIPDCYADLGFKTISTNPCGEVTLCASDSCRLLILNLYSYVENPFTKETNFNFNLFKEHVRIAQRLMDDLIDLELEKIDKIINKINNDPEDEEIKRVELNLWKNIKDKCIKGRRTGLGITAEGDMLAALGLRYGTDEATDFSIKVHKQLKLSAYVSSIEMAKERGSFKLYDAKREENNPFIKRIKNENSEIYQDMIKYGRRNIALLTIAPTGSMSILSQTSSGIEPVFMVFYKRRRKINPNDKNTRVDFVDSIGDSWQEYPVFHHKFITYLEINGYNIEEVINMNKEEIEKIVKKSPYYKATANDVDWVKKVEMQGKIQKHVDHSISVTVNLPENVSEELVSKVYETGWSSGCFKEGNHVYVKDGIKDISQINIDDLVYGNDGKLHRVNEIYDLPEEIRKFVKLNICGHEGIESTSEHPFLVVELDESENKKSWEERSKKIIWKKANDININDHLLIPKNIETNKNYITSLDLNTYLKRDYLEENGRLWLCRTLPWCKDKKVKSANSVSIPKTIEISEDFCWFLGWFIAEGHFDSESYVRLTLNYDTEQHIGDKCINVISNIFGINGYKEKIESNNGKSLRIQFGSKLLHDVMKQLCGQYSENKHLPEWFMSIHPNMLSLIIENHYNGDKGITISQRLARELFMARNILGQRVYMHQNYGEGYEVRQKLGSIDTCAKIFDDYKSYRVSNKETCFSDEKVYNFSVEDVDSYIVNGFVVHNCKGITIYREGSRSGVLISETEKKENEKQKFFDDNHAPKRPKFLDADVYRFINKGEKWIAFIGLLDGRPYEIFTGKEEEFEIPKIVENGIIRRLKIDGNTRYDFIINHKTDDVMVIEGLSKAFNSDYHNYARMISGILRHGMPLQYVVDLVESLNLGEEALSSWKSGVVRSIKKYIKDGTKAKSSKCSECGTEDSMVFAEGCLRCKQCGLSKCG